MSVLIFEIINYNLKVFNKLVFHICSIWAIMGRQNKPPPGLPPAPWAWPRQVNLEKGRALIDRGVKDEGNSVIKWCALISSLHTHKVTGEGGW